MAEWLGRGLQNLVQRFESASDLKATNIVSRFFCVHIRRAVAGTVSVQSIKKPA